MKPLYFLGLILLFSLSCRNAGNKIVHEELAAAPPDIMRTTGGMDVSAPPEAPMEVASTKIVRDGHIIFKVPDIEVAKSRVDSLVKALNGFYASEALHNDFTGASYQLQIRIPAKQFDHFVNVLSEGMHITYQVVNARDVTTEFIDLEARLEARRNYLRRYNQLLRQADSVKDIVAIEEQLLKLIEEIESAEGRLNYLKKQVDMSSLHVAITSEYRFVPEKRDRFAERVKRSLFKGWQGFISFILLLFKGWPFVLLLLGTLISIKYLRPKKKKKKKGF